jgi:hypothetical protein
MFFVHKIIIYIYLAPSMCQTTSPYSTRTSISEMSFRLYSAKCHPTWYSNKHNIIPCMHRYA